MLSGDPGLWPNTPAVVSDADKFGSNVSIGASNGLTPRSTGTTGGFLSRLSLVMAATVRSISLSHHALS
jgi:hypothetical protein